ncbi:MAG: hypothetical protein ACOYIO_09390 [Eubacteriales bacterium]|jgi:hypothetical protein
MASKWKYAALPAKERLSKIRAGNKEVYESEIARSAEIARSRKELGLDTTEQRAWIDRVSTAYNKANAERLGIPQSAVNTTGYADRLLDTGKTASGSQKRFVTRRNKRTEQLAAVQALDEELARKIASAEKARESVVEWLLNNGIDASGTQGKRFLEQADKEIAAKVESYKNRYRAELKRKLANIR